MRQQKVPFHRDLPQGVILVLFIPRTAAVQPPLLSTGPILTWLLCWGIQHLALAWGVDGRWVLTPRTVQGDRPLFTTFFPFPRVTKALPEPPAPR